MWDKARAYAQRAGERAQRLYAPRAAVEHFTRALQAAQHLAQTAGREGPPQAALISPHRARGQAHEMLGEFERALADYEAAVKLARATADARAEWQGLLDLDRIWVGRDYVRAGAYCQRALDLARALAEPALLAQTLNRVGNWRTNTADAAWEALPLHEEALSIFEALGDRGGIAATLRLLGMASYRGCDLPRSTAYFERAVAVFRELDDRRGLVFSLGMLALRAGTSEMDSLTSGAASFAAGARDGARAAQIAREMDWRPGEAFALFQLAAVLGLQGDYAPALEAVGRSLQIADEIAYRQWLTGAHRTLGRLYLDLLALPAAQRHLEQALALARGIGSAF